MKYSSRHSTVSILVISLVVLSSFVAPVYGVSVSYQSGGGGGGTATISGKYNLDRSASLHETARFGSGEVFQGRTVAGTGENSLSQQVSGSGYKVENEIVSVGALSASTSVAACGDGASLSQAVAGGGNLGVSVQGSQGTSSAGQEAVVLGGVISTSQSLTTGNGVASGQSTAMAGAAGYVSSGALSDENRMALAGSFIGDGEMTAALSTTSSSGERAGMGGEVSIYGATWIDDRDLEMVASQSGGVSVSGQQALADGGVGSFGLSAENTNADVLAMAGVSGARSGASGGDGDMVSTNYQGGSYSSYQLIGWRWNQKDPKIQLYLKNDANLQGTGVSDQQAHTAISNAANSWDSAVAQNLFADGQTVIIDPHKNADVYDGYNVHAWHGGGHFQQSPNALAYARTWYGNPVVDGYYQVLDSDVSYNTRYGWSTDLNNMNGKFDVETVALHELGHTIGLADLYLLPSSDPRRHDYEQIMNLYDAPQRYLGNGDLQGARKMYGYPMGPVYKTEYGWAGSTVSGGTDWKQYGSRALYVDVDTSSAGFADTPIYITSLGGCNNHWTMDGISAIYSATPTGFRIYLRDDSGNTITPEIANERGWNLQWIGVPQDMNCAGSTVPGGTDWKQYGSSALYVDVDTSSAGFADTPTYITSLGGSNNHWVMDGVRAIYSATPTGFRIYLLDDSGNTITPEIANQRGWTMQWIGVPQGESFAGSTLAGGTDWKQYGSSALYVDVDTSSAGFADTPTYITSLGGSNNHWAMDGISAIYSATPTGFRIYLRDDLGNTITPEIANQRGWNVQWWAN